MFSGLRQSWSSYIFTLIVSLAILLVVLKVGQHIVESRAVTSELAVSLETIDGSMVGGSGADSSTAMEQTVKSDAHAILILFLGQVIAIVLLASVCGYFLSLIGQPRVIGEIIAGILLGPSVLGFVWPESQPILFPNESLTALFLFSQLGLVLFMFIVGLDLNLAFLRSSSMQVVFISHVSVVAPFVLGVALAAMLFRDYAPQEIGFIAFALFIGIAMSITAFPVLARIIRDRGLSRTPLGHTALACAAVDDVTAWCLLALIVVAAKSGTFGGAFVLMALVVLFVAVMVWIVNPVWRRLLVVLSPDGKLNQANMVCTILIVLATSAVAELVGLHALFGAFLAGAIMPNKEHLSALIAARIEDLSSLVLLPIFFAYVGIRTDIGLLNDAASWAMCGVIIIVAVLGKFCGSAFAARWMGFPWSVSLSIGALMNTRGLMELVVLNIGYELGILSQKLFAMMVIMALVTTFMTGPLLNFIQRRVPER